MQCRRRQDILNPGQEHFQMMVHVMRYVEGCPEIVIRFKKSHFPVNKFDPEALNDDTAAEQMVKTNAITDRSNHIRVRWQYVIRECVNGGHITFERVDSNGNPAAALTKPPLRQTIDVMMEASGMGCVHPSPAP
uniref:Uncharacterized protein n=1 Tax=Spongospora subterranea TaxID=70186 RepID=A0A0H5QKT9_9EUKA|eukprot:CRZ01939.1 hypothetical protein [Spongospora subterranea]